MQPQWAHICSRCLTLVSCHCSWLPWSGRTLYPDFICGRLIANVTMWEERDLGEEDWTWRVVSLSSTVREHIPLLYMTGCTIMEVQPWSPDQPGTSLGLSSLLREIARRKLIYIYKLVNLRCFVTITKTNAAQVPCITITFFVSMVNYSVQVG